MNLRRVPALVQMAAFFSLITVEIHGGLFLKIETAQEDASLFSGSGSETARIGGPYCRFPNFRYHLFSFALICFAFDAIIFLFLCLPMRSIESRISTGNINFIDR